jgi:hypothetical protein
MFIARTTINTQIHRWTEYGVLLHQRRWYISEPPGFTRLKFTYIETATFLYSCGTVSFRDFSFTIHTGKHQNLTPLSHYQLTVTRFSQSIKQPLNQVMITPVTVN